MAVGEGESLASLGELLGVAREQRGEFFALTQREYARLFPASDTKPREMLTALHRLLAEQPILLRPVAR
jgi:hypothetical protein